MAKDRLNDYSTSAASNTDIGGINIQGSAPVSNMDNGLREAMTHIADWIAGTAPVKDTANFCDPSDTSKIFRLDAGSITTATTRVLTVPDATGTLPLIGLAQTWTATQTWSGVAEAINLRSTGVGTGQAFIRFRDSANTAIGYVGLGNAGNDGLSFTRNTVGNITIDAQATGTLTFTGVGTFNQLTRFDAGISFGNDDTLTYDDATNTFSLKSDAGETGTILSTGRLRLVDTNDASLSSTTHAFQIGPTAGTNLVIDTNEIMVRNNGAAEALILNADGGDVSVGANGAAASFLLGSAVDFLAGTTSVIAPASTTTEGMSYDVSANILALNNSNGSSFHAQRTTTDGAIAIFYRQTTTVGSISVTTTNTAYNTSSDYRRKPIREALSGFWDRLSAVLPRRFQWDTGQWDAGFIAHEFAEVYPSAVTGEKDAVDEDGNPVYQTMQASASPVMADIIAALQDINARLSALEKS